MFKLTLEQVVASIEALSSEDKEELKGRLPNILDKKGSDCTTQQGQFMNNKIGDV